MSHIPKVMHAFVRLLSYPDSQTATAAELLYVVLQGEIPLAAQQAAEFGEFIERHSLWELEEEFARTFDVNPTCALEVGWHLFGEEYARGMFLVRMRQELRKYGLSESTELPDHISHVLALVAEMPDDEATRFVQACVLPAVETMSQALQKQQTPYRHVVACLATVMRHRWGSSDKEDGPRVLASRTLESDPLRAYPVAEVGCDSGCGGSCDDHVEFVPLTIDMRGAGQTPPTVTPPAEAKR